MAKQSGSLANVLIDAPWWVSVLLSFAVYIIAGHILPVIDAENPITDMVLKAFKIPAPFFAGMILLIAPFAYFNSRRKAKQLDMQQNIDSIRSLHWRNFEELVAEAYRRKGYHVIEGGYGADGGIDLELVKDGQVTLVQCKQWKTQKVGVSVIREMFGVLTASNASRVIVICSGRYTDQARAFAHDKPIELVDGVLLTSLIKEVQNAPAMENKPITQAKTCPRCGNELTQRVAKRGPNAGNTFLGCTNFPTCRYTTQD